MSVAEQSGGPEASLATPPWDPDYDAALGLSAGGPGGGTGGGSDGGRGYGGGHGGDRMPPQDADAEMSVLGSMLLSKDAIADVVETIRGTDFYRPAHETVFDAIVDLYGRGDRE